MVYLGYATFVTKDLMKEVQCGKNEADQVITSEHIFCISSYLYGECLHQWNKKNKAKRLSYILNGSSV